MNNLEKWRESCYQKLRKMFSKDKCFEEHKNKDGKCYGVLGGDKSTDYLNYDCIGCPHCTFVNKE